MACLTGSGFDVEVKLKHPGARLPGQLGYFELADSLFRDCATCWQVLSGIPGLYPLDGQVCCSCGNQKCPPRAKSLLGENF